MAVEGNWSEHDPLLMRAKIVDDMLANFAERVASQVGSVDCEDVDEFLQNTMDDRFNAEIEKEMCTPLTSVLVKLYAELIANDATGMQYVLTEPVFETVLREKQPMGLTGVFQNPVPLPVMQEQCEAAHGSLGPQQQQIGAQQQAEKGDGWTVVTRGKPRNKKSSPIHQKETGEDQEMSDSI